MPRKKSKPVAEHVETHESDAIEAMCKEMKPLTPEELRGEPFVPGDAHEPPSATAADLDFPVNSFVRMTAKPEPAPVSGVSLDDRQGIRIDVERERQPGQVSPRVLIKFRNDCPPSEAEKAVLRAEKFSYSAPDKAWVAPKSAANLVLAKRAVNAITHELRGDAGAALFV